MQLLLIRHAEPIRSEDTGDPPLDQRGVRQAEALAASLAAEPVDAIVTSPLHRAAQTAAIVAGDRPVQVEDGIAEWDRDSLSYIPVEELRALKDERWEEMIRGDQADATFTQRVIETIDRVIAANPGATVAVVCHGGVINHYVCDVLGLPPQLFFEPRYASISRIAASRSGVRSVVSLNETAHLRDLL